MTTTFEDRKNAYEAKFVRDEELNFRVHARRNKLFGLWIADQLHLRDEKAEQYALSVVDADIIEKGEEDLIEKVTHDLETAGVAADRDAILQRLHVYLEEARKQLLPEIR